MIAAPVSGAGQIEYAYTGTVLQVIGLTGSGVSIGDTMAGSFVAEAATPPTVFDANTVQYNGAVIGGTHSINGNAWTFQSGMPNFVYVRNDAPYFGFVADELAILSKVGGPSLAGLPSDYARIFLGSQTAAPNGAITSLAMPTSLDLSSFQTAQGELRFGSASSSGSIQFALTSVIASAVPEPTTVAMCVLGLAVLALRHRRKRR